MVTGRSTFKDFLKKTRVIDTRISAEGTPSLILHFFSLNESLIAPVIVYTVLYYKKIDALME